MADTHSPRRKSVFYRLLPVLAALLILNIPAAAQTLAGALRGTVAAKTTGALIPGAHIVVRNETFKVRRETVTGADGRFTLTDLPVGSGYEISVSAEGFGRAARDQLSVKSGDESAVDFALEVGELDESVTVTGEGGGYQATEASTATKIDVPLRDVPQAINVVPAALFKDQGARSVQDVLRNVPGVGFSHGDGQRDQVTIRGFSAISDQYVDGVRDDALYFRDLANVERVEVLKGPSSVLYGRGSSGGIINRITKKPTGQALRELSFSYGSFDAKRVTADLGDALTDRLHYRLNAAYENSGGFRDEYFLRRYLVAPSLQIKFTPRTTLLLQFDHLNDRRLTDFGIPAINGRPVNVPVSTYYGSGDGRADDYTRAKVTSGGATFEHQFGGSSFRNVLRAYRYDLDRNNTLPGGVIGSEVSRTRGKVRRQEDGLFNQTELTSEAKVAGTRHQLLYGAEVARQNKDQYFLNVANIDRVPLFNPGKKRVPPIPANARPGTDNVGILTTAGVYVQDLVTLGEHWKALLGARYDYFDQKTEERIPGRSNLKRVDRAFSPRAGLVYQPREWGSFYASVSRSFQPSGESFPIAANNADIKPEETRGYEAGAKFDLFRRAASTTFSIFRLDRTNIKTTDPAAPSRLIPIGEQRTDGFEWTGTGSVGRHWLISSGYAYLDARITKSNTVVGRVPLQGKRPSLTPVHSGNLWVRREIGRGFAAAGGVQAVGARFASPDDTVTLPGYAVTDAALFYHAERYELGLNVNNLFDRRYFVSAHGGSNILNLPGAPRNAQVTLRVRF